MDYFAREDDEESGLVFEMRKSDFDRMKPENVRANVQSHARQLGPGPDQPAEALQAHHGPIARLTRQRAIRRRHLPRSASLLTAAPTGQRRAQLRNSLRQMQERRERRSCAGRRLDFAGPGVGSAPLVDTRLTEESDDSATSRVSAAARIRPVRR
jgi:hypothetical protein